MTVWGVSESGGRWEFGGSGSGPAAAQADRGIPPAAIWGRVERTGGDRGRGSGFIELAELGEEVLGVGFDSVDGAFGGGETKFAAVAHHPEACGFVAGAVDVGVVADVADQTVGVAADEGVGEGGSIADVSAGEGEVLAL